MMQKKVLLWVMALTIALLGVNAFAVPIHLEEGTLAASGVPVGSDGEAVEGAEAVAIDAQDFQLLGTLGDDSVLVFLDGAYLKVAAADVPADVFEQVGAARLEALDDLSSLGTVGRGSDKEAVKALQQALIDLGYLTGAADGQFGSQSAKAISAFEKAMGLKETGSADALLQLLIASASQETVNIVADFDPSMYYAPIAGKTQADLTAAFENGLALDYDDISGDGTLGRGTVIELDATGEADIDSYYIELQIVLGVSETDGAVSIVPCAQVRCEGVRRPIMQELLLKSGDSRCTLPITDLQVSLSGVMSVETGVAVLDADALRLVADAADAGELKFRVECKYNAFDGAADASQLSDIAAVGKAGLGL